QNNNNMSSAKRLRERSNTEFKALDATSTQMLQLINARFDEQKDILSKELRESEARVLCNLQEKFQAMAAEISNLTQRVTQLENEVKKVDELQQRLKQQVVDLDARLAAKSIAEEEAAVATNLRWHGVPQVEDENLKMLYHKLCF
ncbi:hypothetical protein KR059_006065, partial [Drosophila kikkawai]